LVNATSFVNYFKSLFYACKHKYKTTKKQQNQAIKGHFFISNVYLEQPLSFGFYLKNFASHKLEKS